jgi:hypothetical protein
MLRSHHLFFVVFWLPYTVHTFMLHTQRGCLNSRFGHISSFFTTLNCFSWCNQKRGNQDRKINLKTNAQAGRRGTGVPFPEEVIDSSLLQIVHISPGTHVNSCDSYFPIIKANKIHSLSDLFDKVMYMFRTGPLSIIRSISTLYT